MKRLITIFVFIVLAAGAVVRAADGFVTFAPRADALPAQDPLYVLTNYSALWPTKAELEQRSR